jgi:hypothetical protein
MRLSGGHALIEGGHNYLHSKQILLMIPERIILQDIEKIPNFCDFVIDIFT